MRGPAVLASVGVLVGAQRFADDDVGPLHLGVGVLVVGRANDEARAHALFLTKARNTSHVNLARWMGPKIGRQGQTSEEEAGGGGACVAPVLSGSSEPERAMNILRTRGGEYRTPLLERCGVVRPHSGRWQRRPLWCVESLSTQRGWPRTAPAQVLRDRDARRVLWVRVARRRCGAFAFRHSRVACASPARQRSG